jgi:diacylglycerol kinase (ATP)
VANKQPLRESFRCAWHGIRHAVAHERNFRLHIVAAILAVALCIVFRVDNVSFFLVLYAIFCVLAAELINTALEALTDLYCGGNIHPLAKVAKDCGAAAVLLAAVQAVAVAVIVALGIFYGN